jgi:hypothetical protein
MIVVYGGASNYFLQVYLFLTVLNRVLPLFKPITFWYFGTARNMCPTNDRRRDKLLTQKKERLGTARINEIEKISILDDVQNGK